MRRSGQEERDSGGSAGLPAGLSVATPDGWRKAGALQSGDRVWCVDGPPQRVVRCVAASLSAGWGVEVPLGVMGNSDAVVLFAGQLVALEFDQAAEIYGDPVALVPARALIGWRAIGPVWLAGVPVVEVWFARPQVVYARSGVLLGCPGDAASGLDPLGPPAPPLTAEQARHLMACVMAQEAGAALRPYAALDAAKRA